MIWVLVAILWLIILVLAIALCVAASEDDRHP